MVAAGALMGVQHVEPSLEDALRAHMSVLASDEFAGREPGTQGEARTLRYIARQFFDMGLVSGTNDPGHPWFAPVQIVAREPAAWGARFARGGRVLAMAPNDTLVLTSGRRGLVERAPLYFVGRGAQIPSRAELAGRIAVLLDRQAAGHHDDMTAAGARYSARQNALLANGAAAVLTVLDGERTMAGVVSRRRRYGYALASEALGGDIEAFITPDAMDRVLGGGSSSVGGVPGLEADADRLDFAPHLMEASGTLEATTRQLTIRTFNAIARLPGRNPSAGAVLVLAHWDHFGTCAAAPAPHLICNGAIDNASGVAAMIEVARRLAHTQPPMERDVYFLATTGEEMGLLGAEAFAESPPVPLTRMVAALNLDSVAIAPAGTPLGVVGKGMTGLDTAIAQVARETKRKLSDSTAPNAYIRRQDGWALMNHDVPAVMVTSAYGDIGRLEHFFETDYHRPEDVVKPSVELGGAAEDVLFHVALVRYLADPQRWPSALPGRGGVNVAAGPVAGVDGVPPPSVAPARSGGPAVGPGNVSSR